jgi:hypothetical protein
MIVHLHILGSLLVVLAVAHAGFPRYFGWRQELPRLSLINRQMMRVHALFIALVLLMIGALCLTSAQELTTTVLGHRIAFFLGLFWALRLLVQLFGYSSRLWKGKTFETVVHLAFSVIWSYVSAVFFLVAVG